ncbi:MAG: thiamine biosynthesis protein [Proteobacteria bacterium]|nr:thiamine biosynthesis protein [Pseudomonadota bacterium]MBU1688048.1 thiamine biosynthesis protein [Pseudomonadota bacterium]
MFSGGLDSILACRLVMAQGITVKAVRFVTPFFGYELLAREDQYRKTTYEKYGIDVTLREVNTPYLQMLKAPAHGYGKNFNPCVDCKILLAKTARELLDEFGASFIITGEVIGQRPMSQRSDTLRIIERDSGCEGLLVRPLCALNLKETKAEQQGLIDRERLLAFSGRTRQPQIKLAATFGIDDYPSPGGGCVLTDPILAKRISEFYEQGMPVRSRDIRLLLTGRQFRLPGGGWLTLGRDEAENEALAMLVEPGDLILDPDDWPGPLGILRGSGGEDQTLAAALLKRYAKKGESLASVGVRIWSQGTDESEALVVFPPLLEDREFAGWLR